MQINKFLKYTFLALLSIVIVVLVGGYFVAKAYEEEITTSVVTALNQEIETEVDVKDIEFSIFRDFPKASLQFNQVFIHSTKAFLVSNPDKDTLLWAQEISLDFNLIDIFYGDYILKQMRLKDAIVKMQIDRKERDNFHFTNAENGDSESHFSVELEKVILNNVSYRFDNFAIHNHFEVYAKQAALTGNLSDDEFGLSTSGSLLLKKIMLEKVHYLMYPNTSLNVDLHVNNSRVKVNKGSIKIGNEYLDLKGAYWYENKSFLDLTASSEHISIENILSNLPTKQQKLFDGFDIGGQMSFELFVKGDVGRNLTPKVEIIASVQSGSLVNRKNNIPLNQIELDAHFLSASSLLKVTNLQATLKESKAKGSFSISGFKPLSIEAQLDIESNLTEIKDFLEMDSLSEFSGKLVASLDFSGQLNTEQKLSKEDIRTFKTSGQIKLSDANIDFVDHDKRSFHDINAELSLDNNNIIIDSLRLQFGASNMKIKGKAYNALAYVLMDEEPLRLNGNVFCDSLSLDDVLNNNSKEKSEKEVFEYPKKIIARFTVDIKKFRSQDFRAEDLYAQVYFNEHHCEISDFGMKSSGGEAHGRALITPLENGTYNFELNSDIGNVEVVQLMKQLHNFGQKTISHENLEGKLSAKTFMKVKLRSDFSVIKESLELVSDFNLSEGELKNFKPLYSMSKFIELSDLEQIKFDNFNNTIQVKNSKLMIPKMEIESSAIDLKVSGEHGFDNAFSYKINVLLSEILGRKARKNKVQNQEFGVIEEDGRGKTSLYLLLEGEGDDINIKYDSKGVKEHIKEEFEAEKTSLKTLLNEEFGLFKKDSAVIKNKNKPKETSTKKQFQIEWDDE